MHLKVKDQGTADIHYDRGTQHGLLAAMAATPWEVARQPPHMCCWWAFPAPLSFSATRFLVRSRFLSDVKTFTATIWLSRQRSRATRWSRFGIGMFLAVR